MTDIFFERIQLCCENLSEALLQYQDLLGQRPVWQGKLVVNDKTGERSFSGKAAFFAFENTLVELYEPDTVNIKPGITGLVISKKQWSEEVKIASPLDVEYLGENNSWRERQFVFGTELSTIHGPKIAVVDSENTTFKNLCSVSSLVPRIDHVVLYSNDAQACLKLFGEDGLGMRLALDKTVEAWGGRMLFFRTGKLTLEIIIPNDAFEGPDYFWGLAYQTGSLATFAQHCLERGIKLSDIRPGRKPKTQVATLKSHTLGVPTLLLENLSESL